MRAMKPLAVAIALTAASSQAFSQAMLEEVIVTATKRAESLQDVPVAVTALTGDKIESAGIQSLEDMSEYIPNVTINSTTSGSAGFIVIRGVGSGNNVGFEQSVGMFIDGVYSGRSRQFLVPFLDVAAVEILKGPQGTLFGKNTVAGAISINSARPTDELEGSVRLHYETEYGTPEVTGVISGALTDRLRGRLAGKYRDQAGWIDNLGTGGEEPEYETQALRGSFEYDASDSVAIYGKLEYGDQEQSGGIFQSIGVDGYAVNRFGVVKHTDLISPLEDGKLDDKKVSASWNPEFVETDSLNGVVQVDWDVADFTVTSITGYSEYESGFSTDADFSDLLWIEQQINEDFDQLSQELRITSPGGERLDYIAGIYLESQQLEMQQTGDTDFSVLGLPIPLPPFSTVNLFDQDGETAAVFGQLTWRFADDWALTGGVRYSYEKKEVTLDAYQADFGTLDANPALDFWAGALAGRVTGKLDDERTTKNVSPSVNLQWDFSDEGMGYLRFSRGFKSGGFNAALQNSNPDEFEFDDEEVNGVELGSKMSLLDGAATLNLALFYTEFTDRQVSTFLESGFVVGNAAESTSKGLEADLRWQATPILRFGLSMAYLKSEYDEFANAGCAPEQLRLNDPLPGCNGGTQDLTGETTTRAPEFSGTFLTNLTLPVGDTMAFTADLDLIYKDEFAIDQSLDSHLTQDSFVKVNARLGLASQDESWFAALVAKNLTDEITSGTGAGVPFFTGSYMASADQPRTYAVEVGFRF